MNASTQWKSTTRFKINPSTASNTCMHVTPHCQDACCTYNWRLPHRFSIRLLMDMRGFFWRFLCSLETNCCKPMQWVQRSLQAKLGVGAICISWVSYKSAAYTIQWRCMDMFEWKTKLNKQCKSLNKFSLGTQNLLMTKSPWGFVCIQVGWTCRSR